MFLDKLQKKLTPDAIPLLEHIITHKSWWDTVGAIASHRGFAYSSGSRPCRA